MSDKFNELFNDFQNKLLPTIKESVTQGYNQVQTVAQDIYNKFEQEFKKPVKHEFKNYGTVCCVLVPCDGGLVLIRRGKKGDDGYGKLGIPGGFQEGDKESGQSLQEVAVRELFEETGIKIRPDQLKLVNAVTDEYRHNVIFFESPELLGKFVDQKFSFDPDEVLEVVFVREPVETAFPYHTMEVKKFFERRK